MGPRYFMMILNDELLTYFLLDNEMYGLTEKGQPSFMKYIPI